LKKHGWLLLHTPHREGEAAHRKSFLVLFFKKELLSLLGLMARVIWRGGTVHDAALMHPTA
jgi:hypothetical protein